MPGRQNQHKTTKEQRQSEEFELLRLEGQPAAHASRSRSPHSLASKCRKKAAKRKASNVGRASRIPHPGLLSLSHRSLERKRNGSCITEKGQGFSIPSLFSCHTTLSRRNQLLRPTKWCSLLFLDLRLLLSSRPPFSTLPGRPIILRYHASLSSFNPASWVLLSRGIPLPH